MGEELMGIIGPFWMPIALYVGVRHVSGEGETSKKMLVPCPLCRVNLGEQRCQIIAARDVKRSSWTTSIVPWDKFGDF